jgi:hypothetical protein
VFVMYKTISMRKKAITNSAKNATATPIVLLHNKGSSIAWRIGDPGKSQLFGPYAKPRVGKRSARFVGNSGSVIRPITPGSESMRAWG